MYASAYDVDRLILVALHPKGTMSDADFHAHVSDMQRLRRSAMAREGATASLLILAESDNTPNALIRQRIAEIENATPLLHVALVTVHPIAPVVTTAMHWLVASRPGFKRSTHSTEKAALDWLAAQGVHPRECFSKLCDAARRRVAQASGG